MTKQQYDDNGHAIPVFRPQVTQTVAYTDVSGAITNPVAAGIRMVRVWCTTDAFITAAITPTAATSHMPITAKVAEYFPVNEGEKIAAVQVSAGGNLHVTELL